MQYSSYSVYSALASDARLDACMIAVMELSKGKAMPYKSNYGVFILPMIDQHSTLVSA